MIRTYSQMHHTDKYSQHSSTIPSIWLNGRVFTYKLSGCGFELRYRKSNLTFMLGKRSKIVLRKIVMFVVATFLECPLRCTVSYSSRLIVTGDYSFDKQQVCSCYLYVHWASMFISGTFEFLNSFLSNTGDFI